MHHQPTLNSLPLLYSTLTGSYCSNIRDNISAHINEISLSQPVRLKIYLFRAIMHNSRTGSRHLCVCVHSHFHTLIQEGLMNSIYPARQFLILPLGIIVRMWYSDQNPASKPRQDIRSCWSATLAMQHPDLKCSSGFVVICCSQLSQYKAFQERPLSFSAASHLSPPFLLITIGQLARPALSAI